MNQTLINPWIQPRSGPVSIALGTMNFGPRVSESASVHIIEHALERGLVYFDTANVYGHGESERILGRALKNRRDQVFIATKAGIGRLDDKPEGLSKPKLFRAVDDSLARLQSDYIDVFYLHTPDYTTPLEETVDALGILMEQGKIRHFGMSNFASWQILFVMELCDEREMPRPAASQVLYNLLIRQLDIEYFKFTREFPLHTTVYNALAGGLLSGRYKKGDPIPEGSRFSKNKMYQNRYWSDRFFDLVEGYREIANSAGLDIASLSYAWLAGRKGVDSILIGPTNTEQLDQAVAACQINLVPEIRSRIDSLHRAFLGTDASYTR